MVLKNGSSWTWAPLPGGWHLLRAYKKEVKRGGQGGERGIQARVNARDKTVNGTALNSPVMMTCGVPTKQQKE